MTTVPTKFKLMPEDWLTIILAAALCIMFVLFAWSCQTPNKANYGNKAGQGQYWKKGAKVNYHRL